MSFEKQKPTLKLHDLQLKTFEFRMSCGAFIYGVLVNVIKITQLLLDDKSFITYNLSKIAFCRACLSCGMANSNVLGALVFPPQIIPNALNTTRISLKWLNIY